MIDPDRLALMKMKNKPEKLAPIFEQLRRHYQSSHAEMEELDSLYQLEGGHVDMQLPEGVPMHIPATPANIVDGLIVQLPIDRPTVTLPSYTKSDQVNSTKMQAWGQDRLRHIRESGEYNTFEHVKAHLMVRGAACNKIIIDESRIPNPPDPSSPHLESELKIFEERKASAEPFIVRPLDPLTVFPSPGNTKDLKFVLEHQVRNISTMDEYTNWTDPVGRKMAEAYRPDRAGDPSRQVLWLEHWSAPLIIDGEIVDEGWYTIEVDGEIVTQVPNPYLLVPYVFDYSGMGMSHHDGDPRHQSIGILSKIKGELNSEIRIKTAWDAQWQYHVFPTWLVRNNAKRAAAMLRKGPGRIIEWGPLGDAKPELSQTKPPDANMITFLSKIEGSMAKYVAPSLAGDDSSEFGILSSIRIGQQLKTIEPIWKNLNGMAGRTLNIMARMSHNRDLTFKVRSGSRENESTLSGDDFKRYDFAVDFERVDPAEDQRNLLIGQSLLEKKQVTYLTFARKFAKTTIDDPEQEQEDLIVERIIDQVVDGGHLIPAVLQGTQDPAEAAEGVLAGQGVPSASPVEQNAGPSASAAVRQAPPQGGGVV
tara:strand:- start:14604 stop:16376 length:1773 start_codon:yes stop_codon:yes gene_type:complete